MYFLSQIAQYFQAKPAIHDYCFVMPNHRSCKFLERELDMASRGVYLMPQVMTITDFMSSLTGKVVVKPVEALFLLYQCYTRIAGNEDYKFDKFVYWGNVVLNDFNDVDLDIELGDELKFPIVEFPFTPLGDIGPKFELAFRAEQKKNGHGRAEMLLHGCFVCSVIQISQC